MDFVIQSLSDKPYRISHPGELATPCLVVFQDRLQFNLRRMDELLHSVSPVFGIESIWPHVKTHKSQWVSRKLMAAGCRGFKATPHEAEMLLAAGAETIFISYPLLQADADRVATLVRENPDREIMVQSAQPDHVSCLSDAAKRQGIQWNYFIDLNVGMNRTGTGPAGALEVYRSAQKDGRFSFQGLHAYDGHNHSPEEEKRRRVSEESVGILMKAVRLFEKNGIRVPRVIMGGTPGFLTDLECLSAIDLEAEIILSPGTWVFFDTNYHRIMPGTFATAALILAQIMDRSTPETATLNLGYKRWAIDQGKIEGFSLQGMEALGWSEEHTVVSVPPDIEANIGDYVLLAPRHACSTVNLWEHFTIIGPDGEIARKDSPIEARNR